MKFIADRTLGKLAKELRMLGYDTLTYRGEDAYSLIRSAREENRVILTRSPKLTPKRPEDRIIRILEDKPSSQLRELVQAEVIHLQEATLFSRCLVCNMLLRQIPRDEAEGEVPDFILYQQKEFFRCPRCSRIYWKGSHHDHMKEKIEELFDQT
ncbi:MAG TPA: Mut7-C RNAse domain-containing protein [Thermodesulfobacteriota bacterium]|nr:Mut7-C RNAse domain-containing protein [Thermodesulfobacteriota bacterium]